MQKLYIFKELSILRIEGQPDYIKGLELTFANKRHLIGHISGCKFRIPVNVIKHLDK